MPKPNTYFSNKQNILNPLSTYINQNQCISSNGLESKKVIDYISNNGGLLYSNAEIPYSCPIINSEYSKVFNVCAEFNSVSNEYNTIIPDYLKNIDQTKVIYPIENNFIKININTNLIYNIKFCLNNGFPIWFSANVDHTLDKLSANTAVFPDISPESIWYSYFDPRTQIPSINGVIINNFSVTGSFIKNSNIITIDKPTSGIDFFVNMVINFKYRKC